MGEPFGTIPTRPSDVRAGRCKSDHLEQEPGALRKWPSESASSSFRSSCTHPSRSCARRSAGRGALGRALLSRERDASWRLPGRRSLLRAVWISDHVPLARRTSRDRSHRALGLLGASCATPLARAPIPDAGCRDLWPILRQAQRASRSPRRRARDARLRRELARDSLAQELLGALRRAFAARAHVESLHRGAVLPRLALAHYPRALSRQPSSVSRA